jgi:uncharacterized DUF497 family protein
VKISLTPHAKQRLSSRKIKISEIKIALQNKTASVPAKKKGRHKICGNANGKLLWVVYELRKASSILIITSYWA